MEEFTRFYVRAYKCPFIHGEIVVEDCPSRGMLCYLKCTIHDLDLLANVAIRLKDSNELIGYVRGII